ncbi:MAG: hypothetical protein R6V49_07010 [Bacteroidales bacterium]
MNQIFDFQRSTALLKLNLNLNRKALLLAVAGFFGFAFITSFFVANNAPGLLQKMHQVFYFIFLYGGVAFAGGSAFRSINSHSKSIAYLGLPASIFEKYLIPWLLSGIVWGIAAIGSYLVFAGLINGLWSAAMGFPFELFNPFTIHMGGKSVMESYAAYFTVHAIFFLGAAAFQKHPVPKTLLAGFIINSLFTFLSLFMMLILFGKFGKFDSEIVMARVKDQNFHHCLRKVLFRGNHWILLRGKALFREPGMLRSSDRLNLKTCI